jgi:hypothetical protein
MIVDNGVEVLVLRVARVIVEHVDLDTHGLEKLGASIDHFTGLIDFVEITTGTAHVLPMAR